MFHFTSLESCFSRYHDVMSLFEAYRASLDLRIHTVRYEDLIADLEGIAQGVFEFLGVAPDDAYLDFHTRNRERLIATPSSSQVTRPMYRTSRNRWQKYSEVLKPFMPIVADFIDRYGYARLGR